MPVKRNTATVRRARPHVTLKYLEPDYARTFQHALAGLAPAASKSRTTAGASWGSTRPSALVVGSGPRSGEFTHLLTYEIPALPQRRTRVPVRFLLPGAVTKGT